MLLVAPVPGRDHVVALDALRTRRLGVRQLALGDSVGPVAEILERRAAELAAGDIHHQLARLARLDATHPCLVRRLEIAERRRDRARRLLSELMAADAA